MKKAIFTFGLFSLMMILTSFTTAEIGGHHKPTIPFPTVQTSMEIGGHHKPTIPFPTTAPAYEIGGHHKPTIPFPGS